MRFAHARFGHYDVIDFVAVLIGSVLSGEPTLFSFYERLVPCAEPFMALFGRNLLPIAQHFLVFWPLLIKPAWKRSAPSFTRIYYPRDKCERLSSALFSTSPRLYAWVVEQHGKLVGYATATQEFSTWDAASFLHMDCLYLREEVRGARLGRLLLREIARLALQLGCVNMQWQTPVWNKRAISFYQHLGAEGKQKVRFFFAEMLLKRFLNEKGKLPCHYGFN